jgi:hypothetical protein
MYGNDAENLYPMNRNVFSTFIEEITTVFTTNDDDDDDDNEDDSAPIRQPRASSASSIANKNRNKNTIIDVDVIKDD